MCSQSQAVSATSTTPTISENTTSNIVNFNMQQQQQQQQPQTQHQQQQQQLQQQQQQQNPYGGTTPLLGGSSMLSPPLSANPFNMQLTGTFDWLSPPKNPSPAIDKRSANALQQNISASDKKSLSSCRYQQHVPGQTTPDFMSMFSSGLGAETVLGRPHNFADSSTSLQQLSHSTTPNQHHQSLVNAGSQLYNSHFSNPAAAAAAAAVVGGPPYNFQQGHGLPSPTIYPPTPPPSAPWIHPWYAGDTF